MKKLALAIMIGSLAVATSASASNWYVQGDLGYSKLKTDDLSKSRFSPSFAVGYKLNDWRFALDYSHYGKLEDTHVEQSYSQRFSAKGQGLGFSAIYDIKINSDLKPYVGARLSVNKAKIDKYEVATNQGITTAKSSSESDYATGIGAVAGVQYSFTPKWALNGGVEYNYLGKFDDTKVKQYGAKVGIRYNF
ncbi:opacity family porin [Lonepinella sp. MS14436]|uniref:opacity family porin n=1 Tax=Lonepinella sp. MS14436 TaxID=3003619 RepID=UPI0036DC8F9B